MSRTARWSSVFLVVFAYLAFSSFARADDELALARPRARATVTIGKGGLASRACKEADFTIQQTADITACYGTSTVAVWQSVVGLAKDYQAAFQTYAVITEDASGAGTGCAPIAGAKPALPKLVDDAQTAVDEAAKALEDAKAKQAAAKLAFNRVKQDHDIQQALTVPGSTQDKITRLQQLAGELAQRQRELEEADRLVASCNDALAKARTSVATAKDAVASAATVAVEKARRTFRAALDSAQQGVSPVEFQAIVENDARRTACSNLREARLVKVFGAESDEQKAKEAEEERASRAAAHQADLFRKGQNIVSGLSSGNGFAEQPGSPDKLVLSLMSALGADEKTNGTQAVLTLNLASLLVHTEQERLALDATVRNLTLRANLPLNSTDAVTTAGPGLTDKNTGAVTRFSLVLGTSLLDDADPRLNRRDFNQCYRTALAMLPPRQFEAGEDDATSRRTDYFDICHHRVAYSQRVAIRVATGFISPAGTQDLSDTKLELVAGAVVWGPTPWLYLNGFVQGVREPSKLNVYGVGISLGSNIGGHGSGVDAWARIGLDVLGMIDYRFGTEALDGKTFTEFRFTPTLRAKIFGNTISQLGIGPRILGSDPDHPALLASLAVTYDADQLIDQQLTNPVSPK